MIENSADLRGFFSSPIAAGRAGSSSPTVQAITMSSARSMGTSRALAQRRDEPTHSGINNVEGMVDVSPGNAVSRRWFEKNSGSHSSDPISAHARQWRPMQ
jgi:hypothetical protein